MGEKVMNGEIQVDHEKLMDQMEDAKSSEMTPLALINRIRGRKRKNAHSPVVKTQKSMKESTIDDSTKTEDKEVIVDLKAKLALREQQIDLLEKQLMKEKELVRKAHQAVEEALPLLRLAENSLLNVNSM